MQWLANFKSLIFESNFQHLKIYIFNDILIFWPAPVTDLKIDWIWHLLLKIEAGVIGPTFILFIFFRVFIIIFAFSYNKHKWNKNAKNVIYNVIYLLKYNKVGPITCIVCHANWLISGFKIRSTLLVDAISSLASDQWHLYIHAWM